MGKIKPSVQKHFWIVILLTFLIIFKYTHILGDIWLVYGNTLITVKNLYHDLNFDFLNFIISAIVGVIGMYFLKKQTKIIENQTEIAEKQNEINLIQLELQCNPLAELVHKSEKNGASISLSIENKGDCLLSNVTFWIIRQDKSLLKRSIVLLQKGTGQIANGDPSILFEFPISYLLVYSNAKTSKIYFNGGTIGVGGMKEIMTSSLLPLVKYESISNLIFEKEFYYRDLETDIEVILNS